MPQYFTPENTEKKLYIWAGSGTTFGSLYQQIQDHFKVNDDTIFIEDFTITAEHIQTRCIGHDLYDSGDYDNYIVVERN